MRDDAESRRRVEVKQNTASVSQTNVVGQVRALRIRYVTDTVVTDADPSYVVFGREVAVSASAEGLGEIAL